MTREDVAFDSCGARCAAWLYRPAAAAGPVPCVVLAHGWTGIREAGLDPYARRFAAAGLAAIVFDYRHFGASEGEPRQLLDIERQLADWGAAVAYARSRPDVDGARVALWGTSFGAGHVLATAARDHGVAAVIAQAPFVDGLANLRFLGLRKVAILTREGLRDWIGARLGRAPHMIKSVGPPGSVAVMTSPDAEPGFRALIPAGVTWIDEAAARIGLHVARYRPGRLASRIDCPVLFCIPDHDAVTPPQLALRAAAAAPRAEVRRYPIVHFDIYRGDGFERAVGDQVEFLTRHLLGRARTAPA